MHRRMGMWAVAVAAALASLGACGGKYVRPVTREKIEPTTDRLIRGGYLVNQICACGACHTTRANGDITSEPERTDAFLGGGNSFVAHGMSDDLWIPNITPDVETGVGAWSDDELMRAIVVYLRSVPPFKQPKPRATPQLGLVARVLFTKLGVQMHAPVHDVPEPDKTVPAKAGEYLATIAACAECHALTKKGARKPSDPQYMAGSEGALSGPSFGQVWASNLTPDKETGLGRYPADKIKHALRDGTRLDGKRMAPPMATMLPHYSGLAEDDMDALVAYLRALPPVHHQVPPRALTPAAKALYGD
ncbi:MAG TPA: c-type cytochrome [Polyangia bacterium]|nr:c-type cytochrome [Polyangia bacterium]